MTTGTMNDGIPPETILKYVQRDNRRLQAENKVLKQQLTDRDHAIAEFKKWQKKAAKWYYEQWLQEGIRLLDEQPEEKLVKTLLNFLRQYSCFKAKVSHLPSIVKNLEKARNELNTVLQQLSSVTPQSQIFKVGDVIYDKRNNRYMTVCSVTDGTYVCTGGTVFRFGQEENYELSDL